MDRDLLVGIVLDDVLVLADIAAADAVKPNLADQGLAKKFREAHDQANLAFSEKKCFGWFQPGATKGVFNFVSWGTRVHSWSGRVGTLDEKRNLASVLGLKIAMLGVADGDALRRWSGNCVHLSCI